MRQGVHLPQLSMAQNSMAKRACVRHVDGVVEHDDAAMADQPVAWRRRPRSRTACRTARAGNRRRAGRRPARRAPAGRVRVPPPMSSTSSPRVRPKAVSKRPPCLTLPASWIGMVPRERPMPKSAIGLGALGEDRRHGGQRDHVVDDGRLAEQALVRRQRRLGADLAALAFEAFEQRGLLAADIGAGADADLEVEGVAEPQPRPGQQPRRGGDRDRRGMRVRDIPSGYRRSPWSAPTARPAIAMPSIRQKGSPSMIMRSAKVPLSPSSALQTMYFCGRPRVGDRLPLDAGREARAAAAAQAGVGDLLAMSPPAPMRDGPLEAAPAAVGRVIVERQRIGDAAAREGEPRLAA